MWKGVAVLAVFLAGCTTAQLTTPCGDGLECMTVDVPANWHDITAGGYPLNVEIRPASGDRIGPLFLNFGGPGATATNALPVFAAVFPGLADRFDLVAMDPRGTDANSPLNHCMQGLDTWLDTDVDSLDPTAYATQKAVIGAWLDNCRATDPELTANMGTMDTVRDMEAVRHVLGDEKITYVGFSYGTILGQMYADTYPDSLRAMYLDGVARPGGPYLDFLDEQVDGFQSSFLDWQTWCSGDGAGQCPMHDDPEGAVSTLLDDLRANPEPVSDGRLLNHTRATYGILDTLYSQGQWKNLANAVDKAENDQPEPLMTLADGYFQRSGGQYSPLMAAYYLTFCHDLELPANDETILDRAAAAQVRSPLFGAGVMMEPSACLASDIPNNPLPETVAAAGSPPILLVIGAHDPATPPSEGQAVAGALDNAQVLTWEGYGHTAMFTSNCVAGDAESYLIDLTLPSTDTCQ